MIVSNQIYSPIELVEKMTGHYYPQTDTKLETKKKLNANGIEFKTFPLKEAASIPKDVYVVLVQYSSEKCFTDYIYEWTVISKKNISKIKEE